jgi:hypothetical protein
MNEERPAQQHAMPQPPQRGNASGFQPFGSPQGQDHAAPRPPQTQQDGSMDGRNRSGMNIERPTTSEHAVPQPPQHGNTAQPGFQPFNSPSNDGHAVPQPPSSRAVSQPDSRGQGAQAQPRYQQNQPSAPRFDGGQKETPRIARPDSRGHVNSEPARGEHPASKPESHPQAQPHSSNPPQRKEQSKDNH